MSVRLLATLVAEWPTLDGYAVSHGMGDLRELPLERVCNFVYYRLTDGADEKGLAKFKAKLWMPPKDVIPDARSPWSAENETKAFAALSARLGATTTAAPPGA